MSLSSVKVHVKVHGQGSRSCSCEMLNIAICQNWWNTIDEFSPFHACTCCCAEDIDRKIQTAFMQLCKFSDEHFPPFKHIYRIFKSINNLSTKTRLGWTLFLSRNNWKAQSKNDPLIFWLFLKVFRSSWILARGHFQKWLRNQGIILALSPPILLQ